MEHFGHLHRAAHARPGERVQPISQTRKSLLDRWCTDFDARNSAIDEIEEYLGQRYLAQRDARTGEQRAKSKDHIIYIGKLRERQC
jgi:hypothetical protein